MLDSKNKNIMKQYKDKIDRVSNLIHMWRDCRRSGLADNTLEIRALLDIEDTLADKECI